jgi:hypothetical protein
LAEILKLMADNKTDSSWKQNHGFWFRNNV